MTSFGETLRSERERRNLSLDGIAQELKISARLLEAIEEERFERLPGGVFTKSFIRQYARYLGLDEEELLGDLQRALEPPAAAPPEAETKKPRMAIPLPRVKEWEAVGDKRSRWSSWVPALALVLLVMLACSGIYYWLQRPRHLAAPRESQPVAAEKPGAAEKPTAVQAASGTAAAHAAAPEPAAAASAAVHPEPTPPAPAAVVAVVEPNPNAAVRVRLTAEEPVWVSARADGKVSFVATLEPKESRFVDANDSVLLKLGNAGGVAIVLNGKPIGPVGPKGQIRTLQLTSGGFQIVPPEPPSPPAAAPDSPTAPPADPL
jgi:cytoskeleton protein RodZ